MLKSFPFRQSATSSASFTDVWEKACLPFTSHTAKTPYTHAPYGLIVSLFTTVYEFSQQSAVGLLYSGSKPID